MSTNTNSIDLLKTNPEYISWYWLSGNPNAIELLRENLDKISWDKLAINPSIFTYDYDKLVERPFTEELMQKVYHPIRFERHLTTYGYDIGDDSYYS